MNDPVNAAADPLPVSDSGPRTTESRDWAGPKTAGVIKLLATVVLPAVFILMLLAMVVMFLTRTPKDAGPATVATPSVSATAPVSAATNDKDAEIARLRSQLAALQSSGGAVSAGPSQSGLITPTYTDPNTPTTVMPNAVAQLSARLDRIEARQRDLARAAAAASAAATLQQASHGDGPFVLQLSAVEASVDDPALIALLRPHAEKGVPSEVSLAVDFPIVAAKAHAAARSATARDDLLSRLGALMGNFISVRRTDTLEGDSPEAVLQRAQARLNTGDLRGAVGYLNRLPSSAQSVLKPWLDRAQARLSVDDATRRLTEAALNRLAQSGEVAPATSGATL